MPSTTARHRTSGPDKILWVLCYHGITVSFQKWNSLMLNRIEKGIKKKEDETGRTILVHPNSVQPLKAELELSPPTTSEVQPWLLTPLGSFSRGEVAQHRQPCPAMFWQFQHPKRKNMLFIWFPSTGHQRIGLSVSPQNLWEQYSLAEDTHTQDKYKNHARYLIRTLNRTSALEGKVCSQIYFRENKYHCLWKVFFWKDGGRWGNWLPDKPTHLAVWWNLNGAITDWPKQGETSVDFTKRNIRIPSVSIANILIKVPAMQWLPHKVQTSLLALNYFHCSNNHSLALAINILLWNT